MIAKIKLINWQAHENLELEFSDSLNIITGLSDAGKSCIRRALDWLIFNANISESDYRREGTDLTSVRITLHSGFEVERVRSNTLNRYILSKDGCDDKVFDSVGRDLPQEIKDVLGLSLIEIDKDSLNLNIANQLSLPFLLDKPASFRAKLFNKLTGNEVLDQVFQSCNKESLSINKDIKSTESQIIKQKEDVENCTKQYKELYDKLQNVVELYTKIEEKIIIYDELKRLASKLKENKEAQDFVKYKLDKIIVISEQTINELRDKAQLLKELTSIQNRLKEVKTNLDKALEEQKLIKIPKINLDELKQKAEMFADLEKVSQKLYKNCDSQKQVTLQIKSIKESSVKFEEQLKELWDKCPTCPLCKQETKKCLT